MKSTRESAGAENACNEFLQAPIPELSELRRLKDGYRNWSIDADSPLYHEELVDISTYGLAGQAYYSRPNAATGAPVAEVPKDLFLRKSLAEKLADINQGLDNLVFRKFFGEYVELYIEDAHRPYGLQKALYEKIFPHLIWQRNPGISDKELALKLKDLIAEPSADEGRPSPHATGGAVDVILRYRQPIPEYVQGSQVDVGHVDGDTSDKVLPDYFELHQPANDEKKLAQRNRRAFYAIMTGEVFGIHTELQVNPTEWWHWSYGDQMWAKLGNKPAALYSLAEKP